jgi:hypothetical protein
MEVDWTRCCKEVFSKNDEDETEFVKQEHEMQKELVDCQREFMNWCCAFVKSGWSHHVEFLLHSSGEIVTSGLDRKSVVQMLLFLYLSMIECSFNRNKLTDNGIKSCAHGGFPFPLNP